jgi:queuosine precursor transporter
VLIPLAYVAAIVAANLAVAWFGLIPIAPGLVAPAGVVFAGLVLLLRDAIKDRRLVAVLIAAGALLSALLSDPVIALASAAAFAVSELVDWAVFELRRRRGTSWAWSAATSNVVAAPLDTVLFLWLSGFGVTAPLVAGQLVGKLLYATLLPLLVVVAVSRVRARRAVQA